MLELLLFSEFIDTNNISLLLFNKLHILSPLESLGTYHQGIATQNTVDFIWGTTSGARSLFVATFIGFLQYLFSQDWYKVYAIFCVLISFAGFVGAVRLVKKIDAWVVIGGLLYALNYWALNWFSSGFWQIYFAYALLPFIVTLPHAFLTVKKHTFQRTFFFSAIYSLFASFIITSQPHFLIMVLIYLIIHGMKVLRRSKKDFLSLIYFYLSSGIIFVFLNLYILIPTLLFPERRFFPTDWYLNIRDVRANGGDSN